MKLWSFCCYAMLLVELEFNYTCCCCGDGLSFAFQRQFTRHHHHHLKTRRETDSGKSNFVGSPSFLQSLRRLPSNHREVSHVSSLPAIVIGCCHCPSAISALLWCDLLCKNSFSFFLLATRKMKSSADRSASADLKFDSNPFLPSCRLFFLLCLTPASLLRKRDLWRSI